MTEENIEPLRSRLPGFFTASAFRSQGQQKAIEAAFDDIDRMVGLANVKRAIADFLSYAEVQRLRSLYRLPEAPLSMNMVFRGPPGTGKTVVARRLGLILKAMDFLQRGHVVEVDRSTLTSMYRDASGAQVQEKVKEATGGVLFIDEAYAIAGISTQRGATQVPGAVQDEAGKQTIETLMKLMEDKRGDLVVIAAGYDEPMRRFLDANPGLASRFNHSIEFEHYSGEELLQILLQNVAKSGYFVHEDANHVAGRFLDRQQGSDDFGNGRGVRNFFENAVTAQAVRLGREGSAIARLAAQQGKGASDEDLNALRLIAVDDIRAAIDKMKNM